MPKRECRMCGAALTGKGCGKAVLCVECWAEVFVRIEAGERQKDLAAELGMHPVSIATKYMIYGGREV